MLPLTHLTASGTLIYKYKTWSEPKILLVCHKKLNVWLCPGGHLELNELPHQAAEREFLEETGIAVRAIAPVSVPTEAEAHSQFLPLPFATNLHWVEQKNFENRKLGKPPLSQWPKGCEKHYNQSYLVTFAKQPQADPSLDQTGFDPAETTDMRWVTFAEAQEVSVWPGIRWEIEQAFRVYNTGELAHIKMH